jgi:hypothetical protein
MRIEIPMRKRLGVAVSKKQHMVLNLPRSRARMFTVENTYGSKLRTLSNPGHHGSQWRLSGGRGLFGEPTAKREITVLARKTPDEPLPALPKADANGKRPLMPTDIEYLGSFISSSGSR